MATIATQMVGLALLLAGVGWGYRWATYGRGPLHVTQQGILLLTLLTLTGGFVGAIPWWLDQASSFAWDLPPLASRLLAAAGWAFALACLRALRHPTKGHLRLIMLMLTIYLLPLALAILRFHLDRQTGGMSRDIERGSRAIHSRPGCRRGSWPWSPNGCSRACFPGSSATARSRGRRSCKRRISSAPKSPPSRSSPSPA